MFLSLVTISRLSRDFVMFQNSTFFWREHGQKLCSGCTKTSFQVKKLFWGRGPSYLPMTSPVWRDTGTPSPHLTPRPHRTFKFWIRASRQARFTSLSMKHGCSAMYVVEYVSIHIMMAAVERRCSEHQMKMLGKVGIVGIPCCRRCCCCC